MNRGVIDLSSDDEYVPKKLKLSTTNEQIIVVDDEDDNSTIAFKDVADLHDFPDSEQNCQSLNESEDKEKIVQRLQVEINQDTYEATHNGDTNGVENTAEEEYESLLRVLSEEKFEQHDKAQEQCKSDINASSSSDVASIKLPMEMEQFLELCRTSIANKSYTVEKKLSKVRYCAQRSIHFISTPTYLNQLQEFMEEIKSQPSKASDLLVKVYLAIKEVVDSNVDHTENEYDMKIERLQCRLREIEDIVAGLGEEEVDFDEEDNSSYIKYNRYMQRANQIHEKICQLQESNPQSGIPYFTRLDFDKSQYNEFNIALSKRYRNPKKHTFPTFYDVDKCLRKCANEKKILITESQLKSEIERCFKELGQLLKKRRGRDLDYIHSAFLPNFEDPAKKDPELDRKIRENWKIARAREWEIMETFVQKQNSGEDPQLSEDSDDSNRRSESNDED